jgi:RNA-directed DNA polymerase
MMEILREYVDDRAVILYCERFLKAKGVNEDGQIVVRDKGTPQGGVITPVLANLYLHEAFDKWMAEEHAGIQFERYADDIVVHCSSEQQARLLKEKIQERLRQYNLELHPEKTRIVYTGIAK